VYGLYTHCGKSLLFCHRKLEEYTRYCRHTLVTAGLLVFGAVKIWHYYSLQWTGWLQPGHAAVPADDSDVNDDNMQKSRSTSSGLSKKKSPVTTAMVERWSHVLRVSLSVSFDQYFNHVFFIQASADCVRKFMFLFNSLTSFVIDAARCKLGLLID